MCFKARKDSTKMLALVNTNDFLNSFSNSLQRIYVTFVIFRMNAKNKMKQIWGYHLKYNGKIEQ